MLTNKLDQLDSTDQQVCIIICMLTNKLDSGFTREMIILEGVSLAELTQVHTWLLAV